MYFLSRKRTVIQAPQQQHPHHSVSAAGGDDVVSNNTTATHESPSQRQVAPRVAGQVKGHSRHKGQSHQNDGRISLLNVNVRRNSQPSLASMPHHQVLSREPLIAFENTYRMGAPDYHFDPPLVERILQGILQDTIAGDHVIYEPIRCRQLSKFLSTKALALIKELGFRRYKLVITVTVGGLKERTSLVSGSRCLWNVASDNHAIATCSGPAVFAVAAAYALYCE